MLEYCQISYCFEQMTIDMYLVNSRIFLNLVVGIRFETKHHDHLFVG